MLNCTCQDPFYFVPNSLVRDSRLHFFQTQIHLKVKDLHYLLIWDIILLDQTLSQILGSFGYDGVRPSEKM